MVLMGPAESNVVLGRLTRAGQLVGFLAIDDQVWFGVKGVWPFRRKMWSEMRHRYRLDLLDDWDEGFLTGDDVAELASGRFRLMGQVLRYEEVAEAKERAVIAERFSDWP
ncbi:MAG: hypothetical protein MUE31_13160 [Candidatus Nanopelagicales bacterium]|jgi:hypothetical protein|nr:hypothetical protein [Candidatus Nanopelagicales bacterium]